MLNSIRSSQDKTEVCIFVSLAPRIAIFMQIKAAVYYFLHSDTNPVCG